MDYTTLNATAAVPQQVDMTLTNNTSSTNCYVQPYNPFPTTYQQPYYSTWTMVSKLSEEQVVDLETRFRAIVQEELAHAFALLLSKEDDEEERDMSQIVGEQGMPL